METFGKVLSVTLELFKKEFTIWGFTFSWWEVFVFTLVAVILGHVIGGYFSGD